VEPQDPPPQQAEADLQGAEDGFSENPPAGLDPFEQGQQPAVELFSDDPEEGLAPPGVQKDSRDPDAKDDPVSGAFDEAPDGAFF
jgi:hypothetical protein